jgi:hypothetical protein
MLVHFDAFVAIPATAALTITLNLFFFYLLSFEEELPSLFKPVLSKIQLWEQRIPGLDKGKALAILAVYTISGPAMIGAPLIWLLQIRGKRAYTLIILGAILNAIVWVGGVYNILWLLVRELIAQARLHHLR